MNLVLLVWNYLRARPWNTGLNIFLLALGVSVITVLLLFNNQLQEKLASNSRGVDLVVGAKGSPMQLILCSVFHADFPTGNINLKEAERIARHRLVKNAIPMALGDSYKGYRIVGTSQAYPELYGATLATGEWWNKHLEVTLGATVAALTGLKPGDKFVSAHGLTTDGHDHEESQYVVTGILTAQHTVIDNLILTDIPGIWKVHGLADSLPTPKQPSPLVPDVEAGDSTREITTLLIQYRNPLAAIQLPRFVNGQSSLQAASPSFETARLFSILGVGADIIRAFAMVLVVISALSIFIALYNSLRERQYDLAIMRSMGASRGRLLISIILEGSSMTLAGTVLGLFLGHAVLATFVTLVDAGRQAGMQPLVFYPEELVMAGTGIVLGIFCSLLPAIQAYRTDIHKVLAGN